MDTAQLIWLIVAIIVVIAIVAVLAVLGRKRSAARAEQQREDNRRKAGELRESAQVADLEARERDAAALRSQAEAKQAEVNARQAEIEAERLRLQAEQHTADARSRHEQAQDHFRKAADLDPDGTRDTAGAGQQDGARMRQEAAEAGGGSMPERGTAAETDARTSPRRPDDGRTA